MKERALKITAKGNLIVIPNKGVDLVRFRKEQISPKLNVNNKNIVRLLYVGRFHPIKGIDYLIEAFAKLNKNYQGVILDIIGITPDKKKYYKKIYEENLLEKIRFRGIIPYEEINNYYRKADILILPSLMEGLSNVLMEAMACGLPIVATNVGGNTELVLPGKGGLLIPPKDTISLSNAILKLVKNPDLRKRMGSYNIKAIKPYNSKNIMKRKEIIINFLYNHFN
jgi:glycosyltransferase involved in cell wall biosynthesis